ncbi:MAG: PHP domain-containing protein [Natronomonas sp.]
MVVADLHLHTTNSDGTLTLESLPAAADRAGIEAVAVTDHDRIHPDLPSPVCVVDDLTVVHGIELRVDPERLDERVDLLGYGVRRTDALESLVERLQADRVRRGGEIIERVEDRLDIELPLEPSDGIGRPHIARAIESVTDYTFQGAFDELIGDGRPCFVARDVPTFAEGRRLLADACGLVSLAHPLRYSNPVEALQLCADLDAVERYYPYEQSVDFRPVDRAIEENDLVITGGSDAHDDDIGSAGLDRDDYRRFRSAVSLA